MRQACTLGLLACALVGAHAAVVTLPAAATVRGDQIRLAELATVEGTAEERAALADLVLGAAPVPGQTRDISLGAVQLRLRQSGLTGITLQCPPTVHITRLAVTVPGEAVAAVAEGWLRTQLAPAPGEEVVLSVYRGAGNVTLADGALTWECKEAGLAYGTVRSVLVSALVDGVPAWRSVVSFRVQRRASVLVLRQRVLGGTPLTPDMVTVESRDITDLQGMPLRSVAEIGERRASSSLNAGAVLTTDAVEPIPLVKRNSQVVVRALRGGLAITMLAVACEDGGVGDLIRVRNPQSHLEFTGQVCPSGELTLVW